MYKVKFTTAYKKSYKLLKRRGLDLTLLDHVVEELCQGSPLDEKYKDHILKGEFAGFHLKGLTRGYQDKASVLHLYLDPRPKSNYQASHTPYTSSL
ncbi:MAG: type II toxin-antitoxin system YafQ family toxin [Blautia sp.]|nr:type II toxin-antitoxin system YafQ family toxin [Blautia sp.]